MTDQKLLHTYYFINRPPFVGTHPAGALKIEAWEPRREAAGIVGWIFWGYAIYDFQLDPQLIWKYELYPADTEELQAYRDWREENDK